MIWPTMDFVYTHYLFSDSVMVGLRTLGVCFDTSINHQIHVTHDCDAVHHYVVDRTSTSSSKGRSILADAFPGAKVVLNHCGGPVCINAYKRDEVFPGWKKSI